MDTKTRIGIQIRELRKARGLTQDQLAALIDRSTEAVSNLERGVSLPGIDTLEKLGEALGIAVKDFFDLPAKGKLGRHRYELLAKLMAAACQLPERELNLAVMQVEAIAANR